MQASSNFTRLTLTGEVTPGSTTDGSGATTIDRCGRYFSLDTSENSSIKGTLLSPILFLPYYILGALTVNLVLLLNRFYD